MASCKGCLRTAGLNWGLHWRCQIMSYSAFALHALLNPGKGRAKCPYRKAEYLKPSSALTVSMSVIDLCSDIYIYVKEEQWQSNN